MLYNIKSCILPFLEISFSSLFHANKPKQVTFQAKKDMIDQTPPSYNREPGSGMNKGRKIFTVSEENPSDE